jgi:hypothetical protein
MLFVWLSISSYQPHKLPVKCIYLTLLAPSNLLDDFHEPLYLNLGPCFRPECLLHQLDHVYAYLHLTTVLMMTTGHLLCLQLYYNLSVPIDGPLDHPVDFPEALTSGFKA